MALLLGLYLCTDSPDDKGTPNGFHDLASSFKTSKHIAFSMEACAPTAPMKELMDNFTPMEMALDAMPRPTLILCKSSRRAGAVLAAYKGVKESKTVHDAMEFAAEHSMSFTMSEGQLV
jgi:hypothetical protein